MTNNKHKFRVSALRTVIMTALLLIQLVPLSVPVSASPSSVGLSSTQQALQPNPLLDIAAQAESTINAAAATDTINLRVVSARTEPRAFDDTGVVKGDPISEYQFLINVDNTGDPYQDRYPDCYPYLDPETNLIPNTSYPDSCDWPSLRAQPGAAPIFTQGDQTILNETSGLQLPPGKYLISVKAEGYKIDGVHFTIPMEEPGLIEVGMQPYPLPTATVTIKVFADQALANGQFDAPGESGLEGFKGFVGEPGGDLSQDAFGNPLCTIYDRDANNLIIFDLEGNPIPVGNTGCLSDADGIIEIPNLHPYRYDVIVVPPDGQNQWVQSTTLEGSKGWDTWLQEGGTGLDNEFVIAGEPFPWTVFGFTPLMDSLNDTSVTGGIKGRILSVSAFVPFNGGLPFYGETWGGLAGSKVRGPIENPVIALNSLSNGDQLVYAGFGDADGYFEINNVPDGDYMLTYWDKPQLHILSFMNVSVNNGEMVDMGTPFLTGWFNYLEGVVFVDENENGQRDPGEQGVSDFPLVLKRRDNSEMDRMSVATTTDGFGNFQFDRGYPYTAWVIFEAYSPSYRTTGYTYQVENQPEKTTIVGDGVDIGVLPIIGQAGTLEWGVKPYQHGENGGIGGTVWYDVARADWDASWLGVEPFQPGIPGLTVNLYTTVRDLNGDLVKEADGSYRKGQLINTTVTEYWERPTSCQARDADGVPTNQLVLPPATPDYECLEGPLMGMQFSNDFGTVDGNWGFGDMIFDPVTGEPLPEPLPLVPDYYLVEVEIPNDSFGRPLYQVVREEDLNVFSGDAFVPQLSPPPYCAGPLHTVDVAGVGSDGPNAVVNPDFAAEGGSPFEGMDMPLCDTLLVDLKDQQSTAPDFNLFTSVPIPGKWRGYIIDDLDLSTNSKELFFGEKAPIGNAPIGVYDYTGRLVHKAVSDPNGVFETLMPSSGTANAATPSGVTPNVYYLLGNDPGQPGAPNPEYKPQWRTIGTSFEIWPGLVVPADLAPTQLSVHIQAPGSNVYTPALCAVDQDTPQFFSVSTPIALTERIRPITILGDGFGATQGSGSVMLDDLEITAVSWSNNRIRAVIPAGMQPGPYQLVISNDGGQSLINGVTIHVLGAGYNPDVFQVGPGRPYTTIQAALDAAAGSAQALVVVFPGTPEQWNPSGAYFENPVMYTPAKLQGVGPGGVYVDEVGTPVSVYGSVVDGRGVLGDTDYAEWWRSVLIPSIDFDGPDNVYEGQVFTVLAKRQAFTSLYKASIDGFTITGGDQQGFPANLWEIGGEPIPGVDPNVQIQGGGIYVHAFARYTQITNNIIRSNGGAYGGAIRVGTPHISQVTSNNSIRIANNQILSNGGTNLAGAIALFQTTRNYDVSYNMICGNFSAEYGGGISHYGYSPGGRIHHNRIYFNRAYDEGGGIMIAGELQANPDQLSPGAGAVRIFNNIIQSNMGNDDGGGIRFLMAGNYPFDVYNNIIVNNISTHAGGGVALNDAPNVRFFNNTVVGNLTTATAATSNGSPQPAGLSTSRNSALLQVTLPGGAPLYSNPLLFNNIFWDNRSGSWDGAGVSGIGLDGDPNPVYKWDMGVESTAFLLNPAYTMLESTQGTTVDDLSPGTNMVGVSPDVVETFTTSVTVLPWRGDTNFVAVHMVALDLPPTMMGNYHLQATSSALDAGVNLYSSVEAPLRDYDWDLRPSGAGYEIGADEYVEGTIPVVLPATAWGASRSIVSELFVPMLLK